MKLTGTKATVGAVVLVAGLVVATAGAAEAKTTVIKVTEITTSVHDTVGNDGPRQGDSYSFRSKLLQHGAKVGTDRGTCVLTTIIGPADNPTGATSRCTVTVTFHRGSITAKGTVTEAFDRLGTVTIPIVGGTGRYAGATGKVRNKQLSDVKSTLTLTVTK